MLVTMMVMMILGCIRVERIIELVARQSNGARGLYLEARLQRCTILLEFVRVCLHHTQMVISHLPDEFVETFYTQLASSDYSIYLRMLSSIYVVISLVLSSTKLLLSQLKHSSADMYIFLSSFNEASRVSSAPERDLYRCA